MDRRISRPARILITTAVLLIAFTTAVAASGDREQSGEASADAPVALYGVMEYLEGEVTVDGDAASIGDRVDSGQLVETGPNGLAEIVFDDRNVFQLRENTTIRLDLQGGQVRTAELEAGSFAAVFDRLRQVAGDTAFEIRTPTAVAGVRGTTFFVRVESAASTYVCTCNGQTELQGLSDTEQLNVDSEYHTAYRFIRGEDGVSTETAPLLYHTDAEMDDLAASIGATIPWYE
ncbi:MAG: hypothetical protein GVY14_12150 [Spirochaetes bacterium]|jgi:hypothetical protein|nr:hypothetical protein [Spirochaetota bacterium]